MLKCEFVAITINSITWLLRKEKWRKQKTGFINPTNKETLYLHSLFKITKFLAVNKVPLIFISTFLSSRFLEKASSKAIFLALFPLYSFFPMSIVSYCVRKFGRMFRAYSSQPLPGFPGTGGAAWPLDVNTSANPCSNAVSVTGLDLPLHRWYQPFERTSSNPRGCIRKLDCGH